jgi:hypothetical protein
MGAGVDIKIWTFCEIDEAGVPVSPGFALLSASSFDSSRTCACYQLAPQLRAGCSFPQFLAVSCTFPPLPVAALGGAYNISVTLYGGKQLDPPV